MYVFMHLSVTRARTSIQLSISLLRAVKYHPPPVVVKYAKSPLVILITPPPGCGELSRPELAARRGALSCHISAVAPRFCLPFVYFDCM